MNDQNTPAFETWTREELNKLAYVMHKQVIDLVEKTSQLRIELKAARLTNELQKDDWK